MQFIKKCFSYAVVQNKNQPEQLREALAQIVPHSFGDHSGCDSWCGFINNPEIPDTYQHKSLPHGKDLCGEDLKNIMAVYINNAEKISRILIS